MRPIALAAVCISLFTPTLAHANVEARAVTSANDAAVADTQPATDPPPAAEPAAPPLAAPRVEASRPAVLPILYGGYIALQAYDVYSTERALHGGAVEANPHLKDLVNNRPLFIGLKAAMTAGPIIAAERLWREHHRGSAIALMAAASGIMAAVAAHNSQVIANQR